MRYKRIIPCLDIINRRVTKGVKFKHNVDLGDPVAMAMRYCADGCDELVLYDILASAENRAIDLELVKQVAEVVADIPFGVGGGIATLEDIEAALAAGADKISLNSQAVKKPELLAQAAQRFGGTRLVLGMDPIKTEKCPSGYEITTHGFRRRTGLDAVVWAQQAEALGVGEIVVNSVDADGTCDGFELEVTRLIATAVKIPVVASGGAGCAAHLADAFTLAHADAAIVAGILHNGITTIQQLKAELRDRNIAVHL